MDEATNGHPAALLMSFSIGEQSIHGAWKPCQLRRLVDLCLVNVTTSRKSIQGILLLECEFQLEISCLLEDILPTLRLRLSI